MSSAGPAIKRYRPYGSVGVVGAGRLSEENSKQAGS